MATIIPVSSFDYVVFGATGDLTQRKLLPALYQRFRDGQIPESSRIIGASRTELGTEDFRARARDALLSFVRPATSTRRSSGASSTTCSTWRWTRSARTGGGS